jgi:hypothetical protein
MGWICSWERGTGNAWNVEERGDERKLRRKWTTKILWHVR